MTGLRPVTLRAPSLRGCVQNRWCDFVNLFWAVPPPDQFLKQKIASPVQASEPIFYFRNWSG